MNKSEEGDPMMPRQSLRSLLADNETYTVPGIFECLGAKIAQNIGFKVIFATGNGVSASLLGKPDVGLMSMREVVDSSANIANCVSIPVIGDADTGYGSVLNVIRTVQEFERAGIAGIFMEDQPTPKRCAYYPGEQRLVTAAEHAAKIRAAKWACTDKDFCVIARTDAFRIYGLEDTIDRARLYTQAGADAIFAIGIPDLATARILADALTVPLIINVNDGDPLTRVDIKDLNAAGVKFVFYPPTARAAVVRALETVLSCLYRTGSTTGVLDQLASLSEFNSLLDVEGLNILETQFTVANTEDSSRK